eukprot:7287619-Alexandrium_andersonii.AAC.1
MANQWADARAVDGDYTSTAVNWRSASPQPRSSAVQSDCTRTESEPVSYTHLTLPTICSV